MAKKARTKPATKGNATSGPGAKNAPARKKAGIKKKPAAKKDKKARRAAREKELITAVEQFCKETTRLCTYSREFFHALHNSGVALPSKSRKALASSARDMRKTARAMKKLAD